MNNDINVDELLKRILEEEEFVKSKIKDYQEYLPEFITSTLKEISNIEEKLSILQKKLKNKDVLSCLLKSFFNIKKASNFVGQIIIYEIAQQTEIVLDGSKNESIKLNKKLIELIIKSSNLIKLICEDANLNNDETFIEEAHQHITKLEEKTKQYLDSAIRNTIQKNDDINFDFLKDFVLEANQITSSIESNILELQKDEKNTDLANIIYKNLHSLKGIAGFTGQTLIQRIAYQTESLIDECHKGNLSVDKSVVDFVLQSIGFVRKICNDFSLTTNKEFLKAIYVHLQDIDNEEQIANIPDEPEESIDDEFLEDFILESNEHIESIEMNVLVLEKEPDNTEIIHTMFRSFHTIKGLAGFVEQSLIQQIAHKTETLMDGCRKGTIKVNKAIVDLILKSSDYIKKICEDVYIVKDSEFVSSVNNHLLSLELYENQFFNGETIEEDTTPTKKLGEILVEQNIIEPKDVEEILDKQQSEYKDMKFGQVLVKEKKAKPNEVLDALKSQQTKQSSIEEYMRISTNKVDNLVDMIGELIITQSLVEQQLSTKLGFDNILNVNFRRLTRITKDLQNLSMFLRMVSLKSTFQKISRIARDTINELGKDINFSTAGDETEIDRIVTEKLLDPLVHLVKNSISHGIESQEVRISRGKLPQGNVKVLAYNKRGSIFIEVSDDGNGIDIQKVYSKALEKNLIDSNKNYTDKEIQEFILLPGFSTLDVANNISGRGVGMDVVKTEISKIGGKIEIDNKPGEGCTFILKIPVNHAVMNGTIIDIRGSNYIIPTVNVKKILQPTEDQWVSTQGVKSMIKVRNDIIPLISVSDIFRIVPNEDDLKLIAILEIDQQYRALPVKNVIGRQEIVVKPTCKEFSDLRYISGMSILGDGKVSLILDIEYLFEAEGVH